MRITVVRDSSIGKDQSGRYRLNGQLARPATHLTSTIAIGKTTGTAAEAIIAYPVANCLGVKRTRISAFLPKSPGQRGFSGVWTGRISCAFLDRDPHFFGLGRGGGHAMGLTLAARLIHTNAAWAGKCAIVGTIERGVLRTGIPRSARNDGQEESSGRHIRLGSGEGRFLQRRRKFAPYEAC
jgi:hypothetical protein